jgi:ferrous iron transport protein A
MHNAVSLTVLHSGQVAEIQQIIGPPDLVRRFEELGLRSGVRLEVVRSGSPCILRIDGVKLCLRSDELSRILVSPRKTA